MLFQISTASLRDLGALYKLERACFEHDAWPLIDLIAVLTFPDVVRLKATVEGNLVGFIAGDPRPSRDLAWIATLGVFPEYRRHGIARALLQACESRLRTRRLRLTVRVSNRAAIQLYEQQGYYTTDVWRKYYNNAEDGIVMEKERQPNGL
jgi:ribosomal protein S18 acetylase RimI-like enzyme